MYAVYRAVPPELVGHRPDVRAELKVLTQPAVIIALFTTVLSSGAMFSLYTYIAPSLDYLMHASPSFITLILILIGVGFTVGNHLGGKFADRALYPTLIGFLLLLMLSMLAYPFVATTALGASLIVFIWAVAAFAIVPPIQMYVMAVADKAPGLAASVNIGAFNLGNALGAALGSAVLSLGLGYAMITIAGAVLTALALLLVWRQQKLKQQSITQINC